uniref:Uncharacterized protein n=1 Tax=Glossina austeni TaxID=7395 RepID=A0A1A9VL13_GLOAU
MSPSGIQTLGNTNEGTLTDVVNSVRHWHGSYPFYIHQLGLQIVKNKNSLLTKSTSQLSINEVERDRQSQQKLVKLKTPYHVLPQECTTQTIKNRISVHNGTFI